MNPVIRHVLRNYFVDSNGDPGASVLLASSGRSGSTWVARVINYRNDFRMMFEPFRGDLVPECRALRPSQYIRPTDRAPALLAAANAVFSGRVRNDWVDKYNRRLFCKRRLIKDIRVNLFLKWVCLNFPQIPVVLLMRHPCAVAQSQMDLAQTDLAWDVDLAKQFLSQPELVEDMLAPFGAEMARAGTKWERQIVAWCVENFVPLKQCSASDVHLMFYEDLCQKPEIEIAKLSGYLGMAFDGRVRATLAAPSQTVRTGLYGQGVSPVVSGDDVVGSWRRTVTKHELKRAMEIVQMFGLDRIYGEEPAPRPDAMDHAFIASGTRSDGLAAPGAARRSNSATGE
jgi:hypothetical protein